MASNENRTPFSFEKIQLVSSHEKKIPFEISGLVTDLDVFEHLDKPYLTAMMVFQDTRNIVNGGNIRGGDTVKVKIRNNDDTSGSMFVDKSFRIDKVISSTRMEQNENSESVVFHLIENHWYESNLYNVNKSYSGSTTEILSKISSEYLSNRKIESSKTDIQRFKVIVPNLTPIESMSWLKNRSTTDGGYPFYLFSTLVDNDLHFKDLKTMMSEKPWNEVIPHSFAASNQGSGEVEMRRTIKTYSHKNSDNLLTLINKGLIGAKHQYLNVTKNILDEVKFDIQKDVITKLNTDGISNEDRPLYSEDFKVGEESFNKIESRLISQVNATSAYPKDKSYSESDTVGEYRRDIISRTVLNLMQSSPMTITVNGFDFANKNYNSVGSVMRIAFLLTSYNENTSKTFDGKKSGDYLVYSAKHSFKSEGYDVTVSCIKLTDGDFE